MSRASTFRSVDPSTGDELATYPNTPADAVDAALERAIAAQREWESVGVEARTRTLRQVAAELRERVDQLADLMAGEMGKPLAQGRAEVEKCAWACEHYAQSAPAGLAREEVKTAASLSYVTYRPIGTVLAVMPWNFPFWQVVRFAAPTLSAGNAVLLKHAPNVGGCALAVEEVFRAAGLAPGLFQTLFVTVDDVAKLIADPRVAGVTLTGSTRAGRAVAEHAGAHLKKVVLELGGSDPYLVLEDADLATAAEACVASRLTNNGQSCIAAKRFIVVDAIRDDFTAAVVETMRTRTFGDPRDDAADLGPLARADLRDTLVRQVEGSVARGARVLLGGKVPVTRGSFYPPTVLAGVVPGMPAFDEETFGPVAAIVAAADEEDAIRLANATPYGLGAAIFTADAGRGEELARDRLQAGSVFVNDFVRSDPRLPFGGIKASGIGRELGLPGLREFTNVKTVVVGHT
jgi:succinate-semialdehyde dehydrogenase/glutarate-semialdehyde dehydrogenase